MFHKKRQITTKKGQITAIVTIAIVFLILFYVITLNMGTVAMRKTQVDNACDTAGLVLASNLGSIGASLKQALGLEGDDDTKEETDYWVIIAIIIAAILTVVSYGALSYGLISLMTAMFIAGSSMLYAAGCVFEFLLGGAASDPGIGQEIGIKMQGLTTEQALAEGTILTTLSVINDPAWVPDLYDSDRDHIKMKWSGGTLAAERKIAGAWAPQAAGLIDKIPQKDHWYFQRLNSLTQQDMGLFVSDLYELIFDDAGYNGAGPIVEYDEDGDGNPDDPWEIDRDGDGTVDLSGFPVEISPGFFLADWIENDLSLFIGDARNGTPTFPPADETLSYYGFGLDFAKQYDKDITEWGSGSPDRREDRLATLYRDIKLFEADLYSMYGADKQSLITSFDVWLQRFYGSGSGDWYDKLGQWIIELNALKAELTSTEQHILDCAEDCEAEKYCNCDAATGCTCGSNVGPECHWKTVWVGDSCYAACDDAYDNCVAGCTTSICRTICSIRRTICKARCRADPSNYATVADGWKGCCGGMLDCCRQCNDTNCAPTHDCSAVLYNTPASGSTYCCDTGCKYLSTTGAMPVDCNNRTTDIPDYVSKIDQVTSWMYSIQTEIKNIADGVAAAKNTEWMYDAIYVWKTQVKDKLGNVLEDPVHMVYVKLDFPGGIKLPWVDQWTKNFGFTTVTGLKDANGSFTVTVVRYDEDMAKQGPLGNFWTLKFRHAQGASDHDNTLNNVLRPLADHFYSVLNDGEACHLNDLVDRTTGDQLYQFAWDHGIGARATFHYGPGSTPPKGAAWTADQRNNDVYIQSRGR